MSRASAVTRILMSCFFKKCSANQMQRNLYKPSSRKSVNTWTATIGHCTKDAKSQDVQIVPSVWAQRCKHDLTMNKIKLQKARLNLDGGKQVYRMNYFETYAPIVTWFAIRLIIIFCMIFCWALQQLDLLWCILKVQSRWTSTWNYHKGSRLHMGILRTT